MREDYKNLTKYFPVNKDNSYRFNDDGFKIAIKNACNDMTRRTMKLKQGQSSVTDQMLTDSLCLENDKSFFGMLKTYFSDEEAPKREATFDEWHEKACKAVMNVLDKYYEPESVTYGKAQKVVNITMKWICCLDGAEKYYKEGYFDHCHMALDSFILEWIYRKGKEEKYKETDNPKIARDNFTSWSNLSNDIENRKYKDGKKIFTYQEIQNIAREICKQKDIGMTPFKAEFYVWKQMQLTLAAEALFDADDSTARNNFKSLKLNDKIKHLTDCMQNISFDKYLI